ncbi:hypothetical protein Asd1617_01126 [Shigella dysenteriae 1617]|uniref:Uncharacterized protein n=1 Tax=Shigella dysenteriae 1617 TaxID=754093 RepID=A0A0A6ZPG3_SHIDY|nr:hypothetical protein Asd1617_01126 [Shigella dysenteriae 1617]
MLVLIRLVTMLPDTIREIFFLLFYALNHSRYAAFCKMTAIFYCVA